MTTLQCRTQVFYTGVLISPQPDQEGNKLQRQKMLILIYSIYNHNWRNISTIYIYNKTSIKQNILTIKQSTSVSRFLVNDQRDAQILFFVFISIYNSLHVSSTQCSSSGETIVSIQPLVTVYVGGRDVCRLEEELVFFQPAHSSATNIDYYQMLY